MNKEMKEPELEKEEPQEQEYTPETATEEIPLEVENDTMTDWEEKYNDLQNTYLRLNAEFDNYRKRTLKEKMELLKSGSERVVIDVVTVIDDIERALENIETATDIDAVKEGVNLIYAKFQNLLLKHGVKEMQTIGQPFDTEKHEALTSIEATANQDKGSIVDCIQKGYTLDDKVIRFPKVIVAK